MANRMDRYTKETPKKASTRVDKNQGLYDNYLENAKFTEYTDDVNSNAIDLSGITNTSKTREDYLKNKEIGEFFSEAESLNQKEVNFDYREETKDYDINKIIETAKKNRVEEDELEKKRKLRNSEYNATEAKDKDVTEVHVTTDEYQKTTGLSEDETKNLKELINTIYDAALKGELDVEVEEEKKELDEKEEDKDDENSLVTGDIEDASLLSDLMPEPEPVTLVTDKILQGEIIAGMGDNMKLRSSSEEEQDDEVAEEETETDDETKVEESEPKEEIDDSFYTQSNKITEKDLDDEMDTEFVENSSPIWDIIKVVLIVLLICAIILVGYFIFVK